MQQTTLTLINPLGMHARAASKLVDVAKAYASDIQITFEGRTVDAKSIMSLLMLGAAVGSELTVTVDGEDEESAITAVKALIDAGFHELDDH